MGMRNSIRSKTDRRCQPLQGRLPQGSAARPGTRAMRRTRGSLQSSRSSREVERNSVEAEEHRRAGEREAGAVRHKVHPHALEAARERNAGLSRNNQVGLGGILDGYLSYRLDLLWAEFASSSPKLLLTFRGSGQPEARLDPCKGGRGTCRRPRSLCRRSRSPQSVRRQGRAAVRGVLGRLFSLAQ